MKIWQFELRYLNPAFVGDAIHSGAWRTPPIKTLLRHWWRVAYAAQHGFNVDITAMKTDEGLLFGFAADGERASQKSELRLRLNRWGAGSWSQWSPLPGVYHPEVQRKVASDLYLGFGPLDGKTMTFKRGAAIDAGEQGLFTIAAPDEHASILEEALALVHLYGTLGGRSRNGWGSIELSPLAGTGCLPIEADGRFRRNWKDALGLDWPHAIGESSKGALIWQTEPFADWRGAMVRLAKLKIDLRTGFQFTQGKHAPHPEERHWLSYPVTNHDVAKWKSARLPNTLRFKLRRDAADPTKLRGLIFHVPCRPPRDPFQPDTGTLQSVWSKAHDFLDADRQLQRIPY